jgi:hypothetical protein
VVVEHTRLALAVMQEAEDAVRSGVVSEPLAIETLNAVIDVVQLSVVRGFEQAGARSGLPQT